MIPVGRLSLDFDAALGRWLGVLQVEAWAPIPGLSGPDGARTTLGRLLRLAAFIDVGSVYGLERLPEQPEVLAGVGAGIRLVLGGATLRLDVASPVGDLVRGHPEIGLYTSLSTPQSALLGSAVGL